MLILFKGTGTQAGDLAEMQALGETIGQSRTPANKLIVGSVKTNVSCAVSDGEISLTLRRLAISKLRPVLQVSSRVF